jgi:nucleoid-associated protein YgaU
MSMFQSRNARALGGVAVVAIVAVVAYAFANRTGQTSDPAMPTAVATAVPKTVTPEPTAVPEPETSDAADVVPLQSPSFDEVRREPDGMTVIAGRAEPGSTVKVISGGSEIATATADSAGKFAAFAVLPPNGKGQVLSLEAAINDAEMRSQDEVILAPMAPAPVVAATPQPTAEDAVEPSEAKMEPATKDTQTAQADPADAAPQTPQPTAPPQQVALLKSTEDGVELLVDTVPNVTGSIALDTITYSEQGEVRLSGRAQTDGATVQVYLDNVAVGKLVVDEDGRWRGDIKDIETGIYTLRVDELNEGGKVISRVETPFKRESAETLARATANYDGPIKAVTVQEGATLWAIARERYGDPTLYLRVFDANREAIRDPDLIYPGQVFDLPD